MKGILHLSFRYIQFNRGKTFILVTCFSILMLLPLSINSLVSLYNQVLLSRAESTPFILGAKGNRYDLILKSIYYYTDYQDAINLSDVDFIQDNKYGTAIPLYLKYTAQKLYTSEESVHSIEKFPVVGTNLSYFEFRKLNVITGTGPLFMGDAVVGAKVAKRLDIKVGDFIVSSPQSAYDQSQSFQLKMPIVGILGENNTPDDQAVFVDLKTSWVIDGIVHGHENVEYLKDTMLINLEMTTDSNIVTTAKIMQYQEITDENRDEFHFHGEPDDFPLTSLIFIPASKKQRVMATAYYDKHPTRNLLIPTNVINELMGFVFKIKQFINANYLLVYLTIIMLTGLIFTLSTRLRKSEFDTLTKIGTSRKTAFLLTLTEIVLVLGTSIIIAFVGSAILLSLAASLTTKYL